MAEACSLELWYGATTDDWEAHGRETKNNNSNNNENFNCIQQVQKGNICELASRAKCATA